MITRFVRTYIRTEKDRNNFYVTIPQGDQVSWLRANVVIYFNTLDNKIITTNTLSK